MKKLLIETLIGFTLIFPLTTTTAMAADIEVTNSAATNGSITVSNLSIDGIDAPVVGKKLDYSAIVHTKEGYKWETAVVWLTSNGKVATVAKAGETYYPTIAFYVPPKFKLSSDSFTISFSDSQAKLFGGKKLLSVFDSSSGLTFIFSPEISSISSTGSDSEASDSLTSIINNERISRWSSAPSSLPAAVEQSSSIAAQSTSPITDSTSNSGSSSSNSESNTNNNSSDNAENDAPKKSLVDIYCSKTATNAINEDDLEKLANLIINTLQPQAVNLLINSFPAFKEAAENNEIGKEIGLYIYYKEGDNDGQFEHNTPVNALAYVTSSAKEIDDTYKYSYMIGVDVESLVSKDDKKNPIVDETTGKSSIKFDGTDYNVMNYTLVHEMFHAFMDDYNRTGMAGTDKVTDLQTNEKGEFIHENATKYYDTLKLPTWFIEGTASLTENVYEFRHDSFNYYRAKENGEYFDEYTTQALVDNYLGGKDSDGEFCYFDLEYKDAEKDDKGKTIDTTNCNYVSGYLASLYLSELAYERINNAQINNNIYNINAKSSERYREGLNYILEKMHSGTTLDEIINDISPVDDNNEKRFSNTNEFEKRFIKGKQSQTSESYYEGDDSQLFVISYLNYLLSLDNDQERNHIANGSILYDLDVNIDEPLDATKEVSSEYFKIIDSNTYVASTVKPEITLIGAGKSEFVPDSANEISDEKTLLAAKVDSSASSSTELEVTDEASSSTSELEVTDEASSSSTELEVTDEASSSASELEVTDEASSSVSKLEVTDEASFSASEL